MRASPRRFGRRLIQLLVGLVLYGVSMAMLVRSGLGVDPWDVFHQGLANHVPLSFGQVTIAVGALVLTHVPRLTPKRTQKELQAARVAAGANPVNKAFPGVYARHNALDAPALDPEGNPVEESVQRVLKVRNQTIDGAEYRGETKARRRELGAKEDQS